MAIYKSAKGVSVDMARLASQNELAIAVSNVRINARGDELGPGGQIIRKQPDVPTVPATGVPVERHVQEQPTQPVVNEQPKVQSALITPLPTVSDTAVTESSKPNNYKGKQ